MIKRLARALIVVLLVLVAAGVGLWLYLRPAPNHNSLKLGSDGAPRTTIELVAPAEFDGLSQDELFDLRRAAVAQHPELLGHEYEPADAVFGQIVDDLPWWGLDGVFYYANGRNSIAGASEESRFLLNPYLLVGLDVFGYGVFGGDFEWDTTRITPDVIASDQFPPVCLPQDLHFDAQNRTADVTYDISACLTKVNEWTAEPATIQDGWFDIIAYNARDFNLNWIYVWYPDSQLPAPNMGDRPIKIAHYIHRGGSCKYPGDCNNMSPFVKELDNYFLESVPASITVYLWKDKPKSRNAVPDMTFIVYLK